ATAPVPESSATADAPPQGSSAGRTRTRTSGVRGGPAHRPTADDREARKGDRAPPRDCIDFLFSRRVLLTPWPVTNATIPRSPALGVAGLTTAGRWGAARQRATG